MVSDDPSLGNQGIASDVRSAWLGVTSARWKNSNAVALKMLPVWRGPWRV